VDKEWLHEAFNDVSQSRLSARIYAIVKTKVNLRVYLTDEKGMVVFDSDEGRAEGEDYSQWNDVKRTLQGTYGARSTRTDPKDPTTSVLHVAAPLRVNGTVVGVVTVCKPVVTSSLFIRSARRKLIITACLAGLAVALLGIITSAWVTRPIRELTAYATAIRDGRKVVLPELGASEIGVMGRALDEMRTALEGKEYVEQYVQTLTHEVKGPLSALRGAAELLEEDMPAEQRARFLRNIRTETDRIQRIVDRLLLLSSLQNRKGLRDVESVDLAELAGDVEESLHPAAAARGVTVKVTHEGAVSVDAELFLVRHAMTNLLQNALDFAPPGSDILVHVRHAGGAAEVSVRDHGPGIPDYALGRIYEPFYSLPRPDSGAKSSGLGLAFVQTVAELHGGSVSVANADGGGVLAVLRLGPGD
jgi:two-component system sensor histidine kinase CreC